jgi:hypothetical protein
MRPETSLFKAFEIFDHAAKLSETASVWGRLAPTHCEPRS